MSIIEGEEIYICRHNIHAGFGEDGLAKEGEIYSQSEIEDAEADLNRLVNAGALEEPTPGEVKKYKKALEEAEKERLRALGIDPDAPETPAASAEVAELKELVAQQADQIQSILQMVQTGQLVPAAAAAGPPAPAPAAETQTTPPAPTPARAPRTSKAAATKTEPAASKTEKVTDPIVPNESGAQEAAKVAANATGNQDDLDLDDPGEDVVTDPENAA